MKQQQKIYTPYVHPPHSSSPPGQSQTPSSTKDVGILLLPLSHVNQTWLVGPTPAHADVPGSSDPSAQSQKSSLTRDAGTTVLPPSQIKVGAQYRA